MCTPDLARAESTFPSLEGQRRQLAIVEGVERARRDLATGNTRVRQPAFRSGDVSLTRREGSSLTRTA
jgi:hypothetical protein